MMKTYIVPSLPAKSFDELNILIQVLQGEINEIQVDIVDGQFVTAISWPFTEVSPMVELHKLNSLPKGVAIEMDCMVLNPEQYFATFFELGIKKVILHYGSTGDMKAAIDDLKEKQVEVGLAFTNDISLNELNPLIALVDYVQVMGIKTVGQQGQPFDERTINTVQEIRSSYPNLTIAVDGSVNETTIVALRDAGVNRFLPGSAVAKATDPKSALANLNLLVATH